MKTVRETGGTAELTAKIEVDAMTREVTGAMTKDVIGEMTKVGTGVMRREETGEILETIVGDRLQTVGRSKWEAECEICVSTATSVARLR